MLLHDATSIVRVERERQIDDKTSVETVYYISSHTPDVVFMAETIRSH
ncbi:hypothetical protein [Thiohalomonas denitrificans]|nr:hypothetical protein [Thiohalomonas denitrificans]